MYFNQYVYQYRGRLRCKGTKTITASSRTPDFDRRYLPLEHWCLYNSSSIFENDLRYTNSQRLVVLFSLLVIAVCFLNSQRLVVCVCFLPIHSGHQVRWTYQPGSHRRKVTHCYIPSSVAVHYLKTELTYLSSQSPGVSIHHSTIIARVISLLLVLYYRAGRPGSSEVPRNPLTRWDVSSIPANGIFLKLKNKNKNAQRVENDEIVSTQNSTSRSTRERNG